METAVLVIAAAVVVSMTSSQPTYDVCQPQANDCCCRRQEEELEVFENHIVVMQGDMSEMRRRQESILNGSTSCRNCASQLQDSAIRLRELEYNIRRWQTEMSRLQREIESILTASITSTTPADSCDCHQLESLQNQYRVMSNDIEQLKVQVAEIRRVTSPASDPVTVQPTVPAAGRKC